MYLIMTASLLIILAGVFLFAFYMIMLHENKSLSPTYKENNNSEQPITDKDGNIYIENSDNTVTKFDSDGNELWTTTGSKISNIEVDDEGNVYSGSDDDTIRKVDPNGNEIWVIDQGNIHSPK